jgi:hypothetical protein
MAGEPCLDRRREGVGVVGIEVMAEESEGKPDRKPVAVTALEGHRRRLVGE